MRVVLTRPQPECEVLASRLATLGHDPIPAPALAIEPCALPTSVIMDLDLYDTIVVTSKPAARLLVDAIDHVWPQLPLGIKALAVGPATAQILTDYGIPCEVAQPHNSEGITAHAMLMQAKRVLLATGQGGREFIDQCLTAAGKPFVRLECYRRAQVRLSPAIHQDLLQRPADAIWATSLDALDAIAQWPIKSWRHLWVPSERIAQAVQPLQAARVSVIGHASDDALIEFMKKEAV